MKQSKGACKAAGLLISLPALAVKPALGQSAAESDERLTESALQEVVVFAQRKEERLQDVPITVNVVSGDELVQRGLTDTDDLQVVVPSLTFVTTGGAGNPYLRGVGTNAGNPNDEPSVATYIDGVYIGSSYANKLNFNAVERVEVLKGPQGTLFGRNATGGVIQIITRDPRSEPSAEVEVGYASFRTPSGSLYATTGLGEKAAIDLAVQYSKQNDGWGHNITTNQETYKQEDLFARSKLLITPNDHLTLRFAVDYGEIDSNVSDYRLPPGVIGIDGQSPPPGKYDTRGVITLDDMGLSRVVARQKGASLRAEYESSIGQLVSISAYRESSGKYEAEADTVPQPWVEARLPIIHESWSQEFQLLSLPTSPIDWVVGLYYYDAEAGYEDVVFSGLAFGSPPGANVGRVELDGIQNTESKSIYAQATAPVFEKTELTAGIRYTDERQTFDAAAFDVPVPRPPEGGFEEWTWRLALDHALTDDVHTYVSYNRGVKGGGFDVLTPGDTGFEPETLDAYEVGLKSEWFDRRLRFNAAYFFYDYQNIQVQVIPAGTQGIVRTTNAAKAEIQGLDVDFEFLPIRNLRLSGGLALVDGEYKRFPNTVAYPASPLEGPAQSIDASGKKTVRTPEVTGTLSAEYRLQSRLGEFPLTMTVSHNDGFYFSADNRLKQDAYTLVNASVSWYLPGDRYSITLWGNNLTDEYYWVQGVPSAFGDLMVPGAPRTFGVSFRMNFSN